MQLRDDLGQGLQRVVQGAAEMAAVQVTRRAVDVQLHGDDAAQGIDEARLLRREDGAVGDDGHVGAHALRLLCHEGCDGL